MNHGPLAASRRIALRCIIAAWLVQPAAAALPLEDLERHLTTLEEKLFATLTTHVPEELLLQFKTEAARDLAAYRSRMGAVSSFARSSSSNSSTSACWSTTSCLSPPACFT